MEANDKRLDVIRDFTLKSLKLNPDKWQEFILENCNRAIIGRFFDTPDLSNLFVQVDAASELLVGLDLSQNIDGKAICFAKGAAGVVTREGVRAVQVAEVPEAAVDAVVTVTEEVRSKVTQQNT